MRNSAAGYLVSSGIGIQDRATPGHQWVHIEEGRPGGRPSFVDYHFGGLVPVMLRFERPLNPYSQIISLVSGQLGQLHTQFREMQASNFLIEMLRQCSHSNLMLISPQVHLGQHLIRERVGHDE